MIDSASMLSEKTGKPPGTIQYVGDNLGTPVSVTRIEYDQNEYSETTLETDSISEFYDISPSKITWFHISGLHNTELISVIGDAAGIHALALEDAVNTTQRSKIEEYSDFLFTVLKILTHDTESGKIKTEQLSIVLKDHCVISFQDGSTDIFRPIKERIKKGLGRLRRKKADYLAYVLMDTVIDQYFAFAETFDNEMEMLEETLFEGNQTQDDLVRIHELKREIMFCRKTLLPIREIYGKIERMETDLIDPSTEIYFRDLEDHVNHVADSVELNREMANSLLSVYHSNISNRMNEVMKILTIISTIFIPLGFVAGIYGMNFKYMPELDFRYGYPAMLLFVLLVAACMILFFKRKKWL